MIKILELHKSLFQYLLTELKKKKSTMTPFVNTGKENMKRSYLLQKDIFTSSLR